MVGNFSDLVRYLLILAQQQQQRYLYNRYMVTKSYMLQAFTDRGTMQMK